MTDRANLLSQMKILKNKAKAARKEGKHDQASAFRSGSERLQRKIKALTPKKSDKGAEKSA